MEREEMIEKLIEEIDDWDIDMLVDTAKFWRREMLENKTLEEVKEAYEHSFPTLEE